MLMSGMPALVETSNYFACLKDGNDEDINATVCPSNCTPNCANNGILSVVVDYFPYLVIPMLSSKVVQPPIARPTPILQIESKLLGSP